jgi:hypothetical protein
LLSVQSSTLQWGPCGGLFWCLGLA